MKRPIKLSSVALLSPAGALALFLAMTVPVTPAHAQDNGFAVVDDCVGGGCPQGTEQPPATDPVGDAELGTGSEGSGPGGPAPEGPDGGNESDGTRN